jgi:hypothetical protein
LVTLKTKLPFALTLFLLPLLLAACGGSSNSGSKNTPNSSDATYQAARDEAGQTPVSDSLAAYAKQLCAPLTTFLDDAGGVMDEIENEPTPEGTVSLEDAFTTGFAALGKLKDPIKNFRDDLKQIDPPNDLSSFHQDLIDEIGFAATALDAISKDGLAGALTLPTPDATPQEPAGFEAAIIQQCGDDIKPFFDEFGGDFSFDGGALLGGADATATPPPPGSIGEPVRSENFELTVHSLDDQYTTSDEYFQPTPGQRYVVVELSLKNVSDTSQDYSSFDFKLHDADNFEYDSTYVNAEHELDGGSLLPGETIRGSVAFQLPVDAQLDRLVYEPGFFGEGRIDIKLR